MTGPKIPDDIHELLAGHVLGDLESAEAEQLQQLLQQRPDLHSELEALQSALAVVPQGLDLSEPAPDLKARLLQNAELPLPADYADELSSTPSPLGAAPNQTGFQAESLRHHLARAFKQACSPRGLATAASALLILSVSTIARLNRQVDQLEAQLTHSLPTSKLTIEPANSAIATLWPGIQALMQDHGQSLQQNSAADVTAKRPVDLAEPLNLTYGDLANLPTLPYDKGLLLGGSNCQLGKTKGIRLSYRWLAAPMPQPVTPAPLTGRDEAAGQTISAYRLQASPTEFPQLPEGAVSLTQADGTNALIWQQGAYLYALVAQLPPETLKNLAYYLEN